MRGILSALDFRPARTTRTEAEDALAALPEPDPEPCFLITVNLFNQLSLTPEQRSRELAFARMTAEERLEYHRGFREGEMDRTAAWIDHVADHLEDADALDRVAAEVRALCADHPAPGIPA